jgi:hypothetical protein
VTFSPCTLHAELFSSPKAVGIRVMTVQQLHSCTTTPRDLLFPLDVHETHAACTNFFIRLELLFFLSEGFIHSA